jgi:hypothetical protein
MQSDSDSDSDSDPSDEENVELEAFLNYDINKKDDPICPSSGCNYPPLQKIVPEEPPKRMGNYTTEGNYEFKNVTNKPIGVEWNSTAKKNDSNTTNTTLVFMKSDMRISEEPAATPAPTSSGGDCSSHQNNFTKCHYKDKPTSPKPVYDRVGSLV